MKSLNRGTRNKTLAGSSRSRGTSPCSVLRLLRFRYFVASVGPLAIVSPGSAKEPPAGTSTPRTPSSWSPDVSPPEVLNQLLFPVPASWPYPARRGHRVNSRPGTQAPPDGCLFFSSQPRWLPPLRHRPVPAQGLCGAGVLSAQSEVLPRASLYPFCRQES